MRADDVMLVMGSRQKIGVRVLMGCFKCTYFLARLFCQKKVRVVFNGTKKVGPSTNRSVHSKSEHSVWIMVRIYYNTSRIDCNRSSSCPKLQDAPTTILEARFPTLMSRTPTSAVKHQGSFSLTPKLGTTSTNT